MRLNLKLNVIEHKDKANFIPLNYQYELSSWIYKTLNNANPEFSEWLHSQGYLTEQKQFKLFCFSNFKISKFKIVQDKLQILSSEISLIISFLPHKTMETFIVGIFKNQKFSIGDKISRTDFEIKTIERIPEPEFKSIMKYNCLSPIFIDKDIDSDKHSRHLSPEDEDFNELFGNNLISKFMAYGEFLQITPCEIKLKTLGKIRKKGITIKSGTKEESKLIAYMFDFELHAPIELQSIGYYAGFGRLNSQGFGCCEIKIER